MKADIKLTISTTYINDDNEHETEDIVHYLGTHDILVDPDDVDLFDLDEVFYPDTVEYINELVESEYERNEYPAVSHTLKAETF